MITQPLSHMGLPFFMEILITTCWSIWSVRNDLIFRDIQPSVQRCRAIFKKEFAQVILRAKAAYQARISQWPVNHVGVSPCLARRPQ